MAALTRAATVSTTIFITAVLTTRGPRSRPEGRPRNRSQYMAHDKRASYAGRGRNLNGTDKLPHEEYVTAWFLSSQAVRCLKPTTAT
jgi:hypothetical protein